MTWLNTRRLPVLLAAATLIPAVVLVWLGVRLLQQDRELDRQRQRERLEVAAGRVALEIDRRLQDFEEELVAGHGIRLHEGGIEPAADSPILFQPVDGPTSQSSFSEIAAIEVEEFQRRNLTNAERTIGVSLRRARSMFARRPSSASVAYCALSINSTTLAVRTTTWLAWVR